MSGSWTREVNDEIFGERESLIGDKDRTKLGLEVNFFSLTVKEVNISDAGSCFVIIKHFNT